MALHRNNRIAPAANHTFSRDGAIAMGMDSFLYKGFESAYNQVGQGLLVERVVASGMNFEDYEGIRVGDNIVGRE